MEALLAFLLSLWPGSEAPIAPRAQPGELVYRQGTMTWRLQEQPCTSELLAAALRGDEGIASGEPKAAVIEQNGVLFAGCWGWDYEADILVADFRGVGIMPREWFSLPEPIRGKPR